MVGDYTAQIGDPTGKSKVRPELGEQEVYENMKTYLDQVNKILLVDDRVFSWLPNSDWFTAVTDFNAAPDTEVELMKGVGKSFNKQTRMHTKYTNGQIVSLTLKSFLWTLKHITLARLLERDMFQERIKKGEHLYMHEMMYPVLQGIDSYALSKIYGSCDLEVGGSDQTFNMLLGRDVMKMNNIDPQAVLAFDILEGLDGKEKMSKSLGNYISIIDLPDEMFGKTMSIPDNLILRYFELATEIFLDEIKKIKIDLDRGTNPRDLKLKLAFEITKLYHGEKEADKAKENFINTFSKKQIPDDMPELKPKDNNIVSVLIEAGFVSSKSDARRDITGGGVKINDEKVSGFDMSVKSGDVVQKGKRFFVKIK